MSIKVRKCTFYREFSHAITFFKMKRFLSCFWHWKEFEDFLISTKTQFQFLLHPVWLQLRLFENDLVPRHLFVGTLYKPAYTNIACINLNWKEGIKHRKNCESCPTQVAWKVKFKCQICLSVFAGCPGPSRPRGTLLLWGSYSANNGERKEKNEIIWMSNRKSKQCEWILQKTAFSHWSRADLH